MTIANLFDVTVLVYTTSCVKHFTKARTKDLPVHGKLCNVTLVSKASYLLLQLDSALFSDETKKLLEQSEMLHCRMKCPCNWQYVNVSQSRPQPLLLLWM